MKLDHLGELRAIVAYWARDFGEVIPAEKMLQSAERIMELLKEYIAEKNNAVDGQVIRRKA